VEQVVGDYEEEFAANYASSDDTVGDNLNFCNPIEADFQ
jgi:hypothetical protein